MILFQWRRHLFQSSKELNRLEKVLIKRYGLKTLFLLLCMDPDFFAEGSDYEKRFFFFFFF